jgi:hypothetical protein
MAAGHAAMWPHWRPGSTPAAAETPQTRPDPGRCCLRPHGRQVLDFYQAASEGPAPVVMHIHGGGWVNGEKNSVPDLEAYLAGGHFRGLHQLPLHLAGPTGGGDAAGRVAAGGRRPRAAVCAEPRGGMEH